MENSKIEIEGILDFDMTTSEIIILLKDNDIYLEDRILANFNDGTKIRITVEKLE